MEATENPFLTTPIDVMKELLIDFKHNFGKSWKKDGTIIKDHSKHFELYNQMINYIWNNRDTEDIKKGTSPYKGCNGIVVD